MCLTFQVPREAALHTAAQKLNPKNNAQLKAALSEDYLKFLFVRHPFERLVSAYVDKFEFGQKSNYMFRSKWMVNV